MGQYRVKVSTKRPVEEESRTLMSASLRHGRSASFLVAESWSQDVGVKPWGRRFWPFTFGQECQTKDLRREQYANVFGRLARAGRTVA